VGPEEVVDVRQRSEKMARDMDLGDALATVREKRIRTKIYPHVTTRKTLIGRNVFYGAPNNHAPLKKIVAHPGTCATKFGIFVAHQLSMRHRIWHFCGAPTLHRHRKLVGHAANFQVDQF
jgi:hypothetical protein